MQRATVILLGVVVGLYCGFCHAEAVAPERELAPIEVRAEFNAESVLNLRYQEWREHQIYVLATVIMSENGYKDNDCKQATAQTVLNRLQDGRWGSTIDEVVSYPNAYATDQEPNEECYIMAEWTLDHPNVFPVNMYYFREGDYHQWDEKGVEDYIELDGTFFSTEGKPIWK